ncbi:beta-2-glycoprotein 1-like isoform X2 [Myripristis murdjan]|uniref:beta-2-glycoprotein 1-like isoform X2 n=1 Tax=Myripristis murdjan TaxID=586833 RepID=UPI00117633EB|nr:beta-2-glycoprotein 1-like isoform X2 [Myripristis murdjan]
MAHILALLLLCPSAFFALPMSDQDNVCARPVLGANIMVSGLQRFFNPGAELVLSCKSGYSPVSGPRTIVCSDRGEWTKTRLMCIPKNCPYPDPLDNGDIYYEDTVYQSTVNYTCNEGYILHGASTIVCQANGTWSASLPECKPVMCDLPPIPEFGKIIFDNSISGNTTKYGIRVTYECRPPYALVGNKRGECTASGSWTEPPECQMVSCPPPPPIENGYMSISLQTEFDYMETVKYGCNGNYVIDGGYEIVCQETGEWSLQPACMAPCTVGIRKGRILYKGRKIWIEDLNSKVLHKEIVSVYCMDKVRKCGYAVPAQCLNGQLKIPECFEEPSSLDYNIHQRSLPSEIQQC